MPAAAGIPQPIGDPEKAAVDTFLNWVAELGDWGRALQKRAAAAKAWCDANP